MKRSRDWLSAANLDYLEFLYRNDPESLENGWRDEIISGNRMSVDSYPSLLDSIINKYRSWGYLKANLDPLGVMEEYEGDFCEGLGAEEADSKIKMNGQLGIDGEILISEVVSVLESHYCGAIGYEFMHMEDVDQKEWLYEVVESVDWRSTISDSRRKLILQDLIEAQMFEEFIQMRYPGAKRFSVEGGESVLVAIRSVIDCCACDGAKEVMIGMPHRGRLSVLAKVLNKPYADIFADFRGNVPDFGLDHISGDVKYHKGFSTIYKTDSSGEISVSLCANPSHLEAVNPVLLGKICAKKDLEYGGDNKKVAGLLLHGDAAFAGQGVVYESMVIGGVSDYCPGGIVNIVVNNQVGFTTDPCCSRPMRHPTFLGKGLDLPIFHVNADDPEAVCFVSRLAADFCRRFNKDIIINLICYRRYGHNEGDEPRFTQPAMYSIIDSHSLPSSIYFDKLLSEGNGAIDQKFFDDLKGSFSLILEDAFTKSGDAEFYKNRRFNEFQGKWSDYKLIPAGGYFDSERLNLGKLSKPYLKKVVARVNTCPENFNLHPKIEKLFNARIEAVEASGTIDWGNAEMLAFATMADFGIRIRLSGQDCCRGTFSHRHAVVVDQKTGDSFSPLASHYGKDLFKVVNSPLSEYAVLGFEYGYSLIDPKVLVLWEAQFGDFVNGAQVIIDQFIAASESKWLNCSGLVMLLPHGYEGQGPEHSSARLERFLQLCADDNIQVVNCTTPANYFHVLRRQIAFPFRKPLIIVTPKSLLRHKKAVSELKELVDGDFLPVIQAPMKQNRRYRKLIFCSGKVFYDLSHFCKEKGIEDVLLVRLEQLYPFPERDILEVLQSVVKKCPKLEVVWCQEEPQNMGGWFFVQPYFSKILEDLTSSKIIKYSGRRASASTASGYLEVHSQQQHDLLEDALS